MTTPEPTIRIAVDPRNPGQFFACCGLLELADRLWPETEGWFDDGAFRIACVGTLTDVLHALVGCKATEVTPLDSGLEVKPLIAPLRLRFEGPEPFVLTLDAWMTVRAEKGKVIAAANPPWNFWSGQQTSLRIWKSLRTALEYQLPTIREAGDENLFAQRMPLTGRFGFDPGAAWNALDVGFSPNEQGMAVASSPAAELLAAIGLQRFQPRMAGDRQSFVYATWGQPLALPVAAAAAAGVVPSPPISTFRGRVVSRGSYAALGYSSPLRGDDDE